MTGVPVTAGSTKTVAAITLTARSTAILNHSTAMLSSSAPFTRRYDIEGLDANGAMKGFKMVPILGSGARGTVGFS